MKKFISVFLSLAMVLTMFATTPLTASAETYTTTIDGITYRIDTETGKAWVDEADESITTANILSEVDGYSVTSIDNRAFFDCTSLTAINVNENNQNYCSENSILFNKDKTELIQYPAGKTDTTYTIPDSVTSIGYEAFCNCTSLTTVTIGDSVTSIGEGAFYNCTSLTAVTIPDSVTRIGDYAFYYCTSLTEVTIGGSVTSIGDWAFSYCTSLTAVTIGDSVTSIGDRAFLACTSLTSINVSENNQNYCSENGVLFNKDKTELIQYPAGKTDTTYTIPDSVTSIGEEAFSGCTSLTAVTIPDSVTSTCNVLREVII